MNLEFAPSDDLRRTADVKACGAGSAGVQAAGAGPIRKVRGPGRKGPAKTQEERNAKRNRKSKFKQWMWTVQLDHTPENWAKVLAFFKDKFWTFAAGQAETGEKEGGQHFQVYAEARKLTAWEELKGHLPGFWEPMYQAGSASKCIAYVTKLETSNQEMKFTHGAPEWQAKTGGLMQAIEMIKAGASWKEVSEQCPMPAVMNYAGLTKLIQTRRQAETKMEQMPDVHVWWGQSGSGKSHSVQEAANKWAQENGEKVATSVKWDGSKLTGYSGEGAIIMQEFRGKMPLDNFLQMTDKWADEQRVLYGTQQMNARWIGITSPTHPSKWWTWSGDDKVNQLKRRLTKIYHLKTVHASVGEIKWNDV